MFNLNKCHFETIHKPKVPSQIFSEGIVLVLQCMQSPYLYYLSLKEQVMLPCHDMHINLKAMRLCLCFLFILKSTLSYTTGIIELWIAFK